MGSGSYRVSPERLRASSLLITSANHAPISDLLARYQQGDPDLCARLGGPPAALESCAAALARCRNHDYRRPELVEALQATNRSLGAGQRTEENIQALLDPNTFVVVTGQQPGLLGGPLFTFFKAVTTVALARHLTDQLDARFVPMFWNASDDHDLAEIERCYLLNAQGEVRRFRVPLLPVGAPSARVQVDDRAADVFRQFMEEVPDGSFRDALEELARPLIGERWPEWFGRILSGLFPDAGLVLFEPCQARPLLEPLLARELEQPLRFPDALRAGAEQLGSLGLDAPLPIDSASALFHLDGERRRRVDPTTDTPDRSTLSADAGLRAVLQSLVLPAPVVVGGPGEVAYWLQLSEAFAALGAPRPVLMPRLRGTLLEPRVRRALDALGLESDDLLLDPDQQQARLPADDPKVALRLNESADRTFSAFERFAVELKGSSSTAGPLEKSLNQARSALRKSLDRLVRQATEMHRQKQGVAAQKVRLVAGAGRPRGSLQERVLNGLPFLSRAGLDLFDRLSREVDPFCFDHRIISTDPRRNDHG